MPCGCDALAKARKESVENREGHVARAKRWQQQWGCPVANAGAFPRNTSHLPPHGKRALDQVEQITGVANLTTCPCAYTRRADFLPALQWRQRRDKGWLLQTHGTHPLPALLVAQIEAMDAGSNARANHELEQMRKQSASKK